MHTHAILTGWDRAIAMLQCGKLQTGFGQRHVITLGVFIQKLLAFSGHRLLVFTEHSIRTFVDFTQRTVHYVNRNIPF